MRNYLVKSLLQERVEMAGKTPYGYQVEITTINHSLTFDISDIIDIGSDYVGFKNYNGEKYYIDYKFIQMLVLK